MVAQFRIEVDEAHYPHEKKKHHPPHHNLDAQITYMKFNYLPDFTHFHFIARQSLGLLASSSTSHSFSILS